MSGRFRVLGWICAWFRSLRGFSVLFGIIVRGRLVLSSVRVIGTWCYLSS